MVTVKNKEPTAAELESETTALFMLGEDSLYSEIKGFENDFKELKRLIKLETAYFIAEYGLEDRLTTSELFAPLSNEQIKRIKTSAKKKLEKLKDDPKANKAFVKYLEKIIAQDTMKAIDEYEYGIRNIVEPIVSDCETRMIATLTDTYKEIEDRSVGLFKLVLGILLLYKFASDNKINRIINESFAGNSISQRFNKYKENIVLETIKIIEQSAAWETRSKTASNNAVKPVDTFNNNIVRLARTEYSRLFNTMLINIFNDIEGVTQYKYSAILDHKTSAICRSLNGKIFNIADAKVGINRPPMHVNCRSTIVPVLP